MPQLYAIDPKQLDVFWGAALPFVKTAMETSAYDTPADVYAAIKEDRAILWLVYNGSEIKAVCVTQLSETAKAKTCSIWIMTGSGREDWQHMLDDIEAFARREGCTHMRHNARPGWAKILKPQGYTMTHVILEKAL